MDPTQQAAPVSHPEPQGRVLDDVQAQLQTLQADALAQGTSSAFQLNALALAALSVVGFWLAHFFAAQQRRVEFSVLRSMGLSARQLLSLMATKGALVMALRLAAGTIIGYSMAQIMVPYLSQALSESLAGVTMKQVLVDWPAVTRSYGLLAVFYVLAMSLLLIALTRVGTHRAMRIGDE